MELIYHYLWQKGLAGRRLRLNDGREAFVMNPGVHNDDAGPDFSGAVIRIDGKVWAGNVEIHVRASDWHRHNHDADRSYNNVILHVVGIDDAEIRRDDGSVIPQVQVSIPDNFAYTYGTLISEVMGIRCSGLIERIPALSRESWLEALGVERLQMKARRIIDYTRKAGGDWEQAAFITLARALGFGLNGEPFEILAKSLPLNHLQRHSDSLAQLEAMLFGTAGMLSAIATDDYEELLQREFSFLSRKYDLKPMACEMWKYARTRPGNFPHRRIALLANVLHNGKSFASMMLDDRIKEANGLKQLRESFTLSAGEYWQKHFQFGAASESVPAHLTAASVTSLLINAVAPFRYAYGRMTGDIEIAEEGQKITAQLGSERNNIVAGWERLGLKSDSAMRSQALIHLRKEYCDRERCLECRFGELLLKMDVTGTSGTPLSQYAEPRALRQRKGIEIAMDSFKGCLSSAEAGNAVAKGILRGNRDASVNVTAVADGGEGMADAIGDYRNLERVEVETYDPLMRPICASYRVDPQINAAFIDSAAASGLTLLKDEERDVTATTSYGTGVMIADALKRGVTTIVLGLGGTATNDAGLGAMQALGCDVQADGDILPASFAICGRHIHSVIGIYPEKMRERLKGVRLMLACDVVSRFVGPDGAVRLFAGQKGADAQTRKILERGMQRLRRILRQTGGRDVGPMRCAGAAGGMAGGFMALTDAEVHSGAAVVAHCLGLKEKIRGKSLLITGEGSSDAQTLEGKLPMVLMQLAATMRVPTLLMAGRVRERERLRSAGFADICDINDGQSRKEDPTDPKVAAKRLAEAAERLVKTGV